ncbi:Adenine phosphoribosyltransferase [Corynebacterium capitovis DSM 44611]|uniref:adenine phosphoribosyltransferase n=1 Tax=Corynebacterium capitovis TaxID=131081 RepID=UPI00039A3F51|nr:adenine phosphoribosyltransferase [Corynebacterium capitovis]WKD57563.1 Adenine phosphoribosyltransferase [Corynebacterium capitovis DSM 44611]
MATTPSTPAKHTTHGPEKTYASAAEALADKIRRVPDFPDQGVVFEDLTPVLADGPALHRVIADLARASEHFGAEVIGGLDARGFLLGSAVAYELGLGILAIRKKGKLPPPVLTQEYVTEYSTAALEIPADGVDLRGKKVVLVDDVLATGGTLVAATDLIERAGGSVVGYVVVLEVEGLGGRERLGDAPLAVLASEPGGDS